MWVAKSRVAPHVGAWIEIVFENHDTSRHKSHPTWVRGLKCGKEVREILYNDVAPHVGAWIEISQINLNEQEAQVAPHVGAWIEILTSREMKKRHEVAPHVGAWIEIRIC